MWIDWRGLFLAVIQIHMMYIDLLHFLYLCRLLQPLNRLLGWWAGSWNCLWRNLGLIRPAGYHLPRLIGIHLRLLGFLCTGGLSLHSLSIYAYGWLAVADHGSCRYRHCSCCVQVLRPFSVWRKLHSYGPWGGKLVHYCQGHYEICGRCVYEIRVESETADWLGWGYCNSVGCPCGCCVRCISPNSTRKDRCLSGRVRVDHIADDETECVHYCVAEEIGEGDHVAQDRTGIASVDPRRVDGIAAGDPTSDGKLSRECKGDRISSGKRGGQPGCGCEELTPVSFVANGVCSSGVCDVGGSGHQQLPELESLDRVDGQHQEKHKA